ncbi:shikimate dehydrogenase [Oculatella sp. LEGE 06141]|uniref:shikimate dehydrogenase n=1 Tax=Oculatella sp. LEGE 06141 TaxID=1828648 RepID=UPI001881F07B|nr:shikimate dehydrogenase [Oculatella sp. LEGE 06141]
MITGQTKLLGVIGYPIAHSLSPVMHNAAIAHLGLDYVYLPFSIQPTELKRAIDGFEAIGLQGFSVTIPHKQTVMPLLQSIAAIAQAVGAVNTIYRTEQGWEGTNTDVAGFISPLTQMQRNWQHTTAVVLGNGGAARAVVAGCAQLGCAQVRVVGRNPQKLQSFLASWVDSPLAVNLSVHPWQELPQLIPQADLLVNTTPIGMNPHPTASPLSDSDAAHLQPGTITYDLIYTPNPTQFLQQAQTQGAIAIDGLEMLVQQGAVALQQWLQQSVPVDVMRQALKQHLKLP